MTRLSFLMGVLLMMVAGCGGHGGTQFSGAPPTAEQAYGSCVFCHRDIGEQLVQNGGHHDLNLKCETCHSDLKPNDPGPGHRSVPACRDCHAQQVSHHDPAGGTASECVVCHTPHGSSNLLLIRESITIPNGVATPVDFSNLGGKADGSFASASHPGTGVCEVCHTQTTHYRNDGSGSAHFSFPCQTCHGHAAGFSPP